MQTTRTLFHQHTPNPNRFSTITFDPDIEHRCMTLFNLLARRSQNQVLISRYTDLTKILEGPTYTKEFKDFLSWLKIERGCKTYGDVLDMGPLLLFDKVKEFHVFELDEHAKRRIEALQKYSEEKNL